MTRAQRHLKILEIIAAQEIETQEDLVEKIKQLGEDITQATISRDIKDLGLMKVLTDKKTYKYIHLESKNKNLSSKFLNLFRESVISVTYSLNNIVIKTLGGSASAAAAMIDKMNVDSILGCIAGDDTILVITKSVESTIEIVEKLNGLLI